jgi:type II secretory pathway component PulF
MPAWFVRKVPLEQLSRLCGNLRVCLSAGMPVPVAVRTCGRTAPCTILRAMLPDAADRVANGMALSDALEHWRERFPAYFVPVLRCGERSGRIDEALDYLERYCRQLAEPARVARNTWLVPLCIMLFGSAVSTVAYLAYGHFAAAASYALRAAVFYATLVVGAIVVQRAPFFGPLVARLRLALPMLGQAERGLAINRFFHAMNMLYSTGGLRVERMIRLAADTVDNVVLREDFLRSAAVVESGGTATEAFAAITSLSAEHRATIAVGDESGKLDAAFEIVCRQTADAAIALLEAFQQAFSRAVAFSVVMSIVATLMSLSR